MVLRLKWPFFIPVEGRTQQGGGWTALLVALGVLLAFGLIVLFFSVYGGPHYYPASH